MTKYPKEFKASIIARMLPPTNASVSALAKETGVPKDTLYSWRITHRGKAGAVSEPGSVHSELTSAAKFSVVLESASMNETDLGEYCRRKGLFPQQIHQWHQLCSEANEASARRVEQAQVREHKRTIKQLQTELNRKEKALAETAALLVLRKKARALWEEVEDERSTFWSADK
jgi:transposase-like protein